MNLSSCPAHPDRKQEMVCISDDCGNRFEPRCVQCVLSSKCKQNHNWKMLSEAIEELFEACETKEVKEEKKQKSIQVVSQTTLDSLKHIEEVVKQFEARIQQFKTKLDKKVENKAQRIKIKLSPSLESYVLVKNTLKTCKKQTLPEEIRQKFKSISEYVRCGSDGAITFQQAVTVEQLQDTDISAFEGKLIELLQNLNYIIDEEGQVPSQTESLMKNYEAQIDKLLDQVKQIPVLQNRIQSLNEKLQAKDAKLKKYEGGSQVPPTSVIHKAAEESNKKEQNDDAEKIKRIQTLIDRRQKMRTTFIQHCQKSPQQELYSYQLKQTENVANLDFPVVTQAAYYLNQCILNIADQLNYLKYSDSTSGEPYVDIPLISTKKQRQPQQNKGSGKRGGSVNSIFDAWF